MGSIATQATITSLKGLGLDGPGMRWLIKLMTDISLEMARGVSVDGLVDTMLGKRWPQANLTGRQREQISLLLAGISRPELNDVILLARNL